MNLRALTAPRKSTFRSQSAKPVVSLRKPTAEDGAAVWKLIAGTESLDGNSRYCNLLQCSHFAETCMLAEAEGEVVGWASGYIPPGEPDTLFIWQVCVSAKARGQGLGKRLLTGLLHRLGERGVRWMKSTITEGNEASWALFGGVAAHFSAPVDRRPHFTREAHFDGRHETEHLMTIGPIATERLSFRAAASHHQQTGKDHAQEQ